MATIYILVVVDVEGTTTSNNLAGNVWMLDTQKYLGEQEASNALITYVNSGDTVYWSLASINPGDNLQFSTNKPFYGQAVPAVINPKASPLADDQYMARVSIPGATAKGTTYQYTMTLSIDGKDYTFDPYLKLLKAT